MSFLIVLKSACQAKKIMKEKTFTSMWAGRELTIKTGKLALQADAAVTVQYGETVVLATVVESKEERDVDFFPLMVEFEERLYAAGIIKGSQWIKREGRPSDDAVLTGRMIDRSIRPLFDESSRKETQVVLTVISADGENDYDIVSLIAASAALSISGIKWAGPIGGIRVGRIDGSLIFNPTYKQRKESDLDLVVAGPKDKIIQIEADSNEISEAEMYEALMAGKNQMAPAIELIEKLKAEVPAPIKEEGLDPTETEEEKTKKEDIKKIIAEAEAWLEKNTNKILFDKSYYQKKERKAAVSAIKKALDIYLFENGHSRDLRALAIKKTVDKAVDSEITKEIIENQRRVDERKLNDLRQISAEIDMLPRNHGAALFSRGETQILSVVTLAGPGLAQSLEGMEGTGTKRFMHHYNFAPFSVGEAKFMRGPGRREIGHGALAEKALQPVLPSKEDFPYTIRVVSETMGSNGSSSMGSTCGSSLALMDAGVPIKKAVAGVAVGLASYEDMSKWAVLTDIQDLEDGRGGMDFKVAGTKDGITAIQLDTKTIGLNDEIIKQALEQGREGRLKILETMNSAISEPKPDLSKYAPRIISLQINPERIREVIGAGGKIINKIVADYGVTVDIEDDGMVLICGADAEKSRQALDFVKNIVREFKPEEIITGKVLRLMDFGAIVELSAGHDGMVHVSEMAPYHVSKPDSLLKVGDLVTVRIKEVDAEAGRISLSMKGLKENEHFWEENKGKSEPGNNGGFGRGSGRSGFRPKRNNFERR